ncbi:MAG TPA: hypothetical protein VKP88_06750 [Candidatus Paceibacterota bacterium]|nr:hypothetical protein [Candidatus Paceibacterota bacterium]
MTRQQFIASVLYSLAKSDLVEVTEMTLKEAYDLVNDRANEEDFDDDKPASNKLPDEYWDKAPDWAKWVAMDKDGQWAWFETKPTKQIDFWFYIYGKCRHFIAPPEADWTKSLTKRP